MNTTTITFERKVREHLEIKIGSCWMLTEVNEFSKTKSTKIAKLLNKEDTMTAELIEYADGRIHVNITSGLPREIGQYKFIEIQEENFIAEFIRITEIAKGIVL